eukprot:TRINITY_DN839_c0_g1_i1.p1 TRINITY_DN839_c0_g1~~TRINITY_DN839_c0_g1_i1.p1  ORF type:complete len:205 (-),score=56.37 TRINITY_DN839_c0_g1_i1:22-636(-)
MPETKRVIPAMLGTATSLAPYGQLINDEVHKPGLGIPFYKGSVIEGSNFDFECRGAPKARTAQIRPRESNECVWLERHMHMTQMFVGLGNRPFVMCLGAPTQDSENPNVPNMDNVRTFVIPGGCGLMIHKGTWHDFPVALDEPVTVLTFNSEEVVIALASMKEPAEMDQGDVYKLHLATKFNKDTFFMDMESAKMIARGLQVQK